jgi:hypothetical protein
LESDVLPLRLNVTDLFEIDNASNPFESKLETQVRARRYGQNSEPG